MNKEFIPYEQALELKDLGFDEQCVGQYFSSLNSDTTKLIVGETHPNFYKLIGIPEDFYYLAPLYQQAFRWFREKYGLYIDLFVDDDNTFGFFITHFTDDARIDSPIYRTKNTYEEAEQACLVKLIEIAKNK